MSPIAEPIQKHVPAWKKLGLKLKFAKEELEDTQPSQNGTFDHQKRKAYAEEEDAVGSASLGTSMEKVKKVKKSKSRVKEDGEAVDGSGPSCEPRDEGKPRKKVKKSRSDIEESSKAVNGRKRSTDEPTNVERPSKKVKKLKVKPNSSDLSISPDDTHRMNSSPPPALKATPASKGKTVSFTPDTKTRDGDSVKSLYKTWIAKQIANDPSFDPSTVSPALRSIVPSIVAPPESPSLIMSTSTSPSTPASKPTTQNNKKQTKKAKTRLPKTSSGVGPSRFDPVLTYLTAHHTSSQNWKFSKSHQNQILKHLFSFSHIPSSYDSALLCYIHGLKGTSARSRVRKGALAVREEDERWLASEPSEMKNLQSETTAQCNARRRRDYEAAVARIKQTLREKEEKREERDWELLGEKEEWEERVRKRRRAEIVLWGVGEEDDEIPDGDGVALPQQDSFDGRPGRPPNSGSAQRAQAARDPGPAPVFARGIGMGMGGVEAIDAGGIARESRSKKVVFGDDGAPRANGTGDGTGRGKKVRYGAGTLDRRDLANYVKPLRKRKRRTGTGVPDDDDESSSESSSGESEEGGKEQGTESSDDETSEDSDSSSSSGTSSSGDSGSDSD